MNIQEIMQQLRANAAKLEPQTSDESVAKFLSRLDEARSCDDVDESNALFVRISLEFFHYIRNNKNWARELPRFDISSEKMGLFCIPAQMIKNGLNCPLIQNDFFLAGMHQLITVLAYDNIMERAFAADELTRWLTIFDDSIDDFFGVFLECAGHIPGPYLAIPEKVTPDECCRMFKLILCNARSSFAKAMPQYAMFDAEEASAFQLENFPDGAPSAEFLRDFLVRFLRVLHFLLFNSRSVD